MELESDPGQVKETSPEMDDELRPEYDPAELLKGGVRGKYVEQYRAGTNLALLPQTSPGPFPPTRPSTKRCAW
ncbi:MAG: hypothetical protein MN733_24340 [Nitrososphaera sp.]|nr:hypothetical protein [Nitrososphaera sp.]